MRMCRFLKRLRLFSNDERNSLWYNNTYSSIDAQKMLWFSYFQLKSHTRDFVCTWSGILSMGNNNPDGSVEVSTIADLRHYRRSDASGVPPCHAHSLKIKRSESCDFIYILNIISILTSHSIRLREGVVFWRLMEGEQSVKHVPFSSRRHTRAIGR